MLDKILQQVNTLLGLDFVHFDEVLRNRRIQIILLKGMLTPHAVTDVCRLSSPAEELAILITSI